MCIRDRLNFENTQVLDKKISYEHKDIRVVLIGPEVPDASISIARSKLKEYKLEETKLTVLQGMNNEAVDVSSIRAMVMEDFYKNSEQRLQEQQKKITRLEENLAQYKEYDTMGRTLVPELKVLYPSITSLSIAHSLETRVDSMKTDTVTLAVLKFGKHPSVAEKEKINCVWLYMTAREYAQLRQMGAGKNFFRLNYYDATTMTKKTKEFYGSDITATEVNGLDRNDIPQGYQTVKWSFIER